MVFTEYVDHHARNIPRAVACVMAAIMTNVNHQGPRVDVNAEFKRIDMGMLYPFSMNEKMRDGYEWPFPF